MDSLQLEGLHLMKLDCEGCEDEALLGSKATISSFLPVVFLEWNVRTKSTECGEGVWMLQGLRYSCWWDEYPGFNNRNYYGLEKNYFVNPGGVPMISVMLLCLPPFAAQRWAEDDVAMRKMVAEMTLFVCTGTRAEVSQGDGESASHFGSV